jgi:hypothetical protein
MRWASDGDDAAVISLVSLLNSGCRWWLATSFLGAEGSFFSSLSLFLPLVLPSLGVFSLAGSFRCLFLLLFVGALYVAWVLFYVGLFSVRTLFFLHLSPTPDLQAQLSAAALASAHWGMNLN